MVRERSMDGNVDDRKGWTWEKGSLEVKEEGEISSETNLQERSLFGRD